MRNMEFTEAELNRLRWRSRRGMLELDLLLLPWFDEVFRQATDEDQQAFMLLLDQEDPEMHEWFNQRQEPEDPELNRIVKKILDRVQPE